MNNKIIIVILGLVVSGVLYGLADQNESFSKKKDSYEYGVIGESIWNGNGIRYHGAYDVVLSPGFPIVIGAFHRLSFDLKWSGIIICSLSFFLCLLLINNIAGFFLNSVHYTWICILIYSSNSNILINAASGYSEMLFTLVMLVMVWLTIDKRQPQFSGLWGSVLFSFLWAWLYTIRAEGLIVGAILFIWLILDQRFNRLNIWITPVLCLILIFPYLFFLKQCTGHWQLSGKTYLNLVMGELQSPYQKKVVDENIVARYQIIDQTLANPSLAHGFSRYWAEHENDIIKRVPTNLLNLLKIYWYSFSIIGLLLGLWGFSGLKMKQIYFILSLLAPILLLLIFFVLARTVAVYHWVWVLLITNGLRNLDRFISVHFQWSSKPIIYVMTLCLIIYQARSVIKVILDFIN